MNGREALFSAFKATLERPLRATGAKAEAEPARRAAERAANFIIVYYSLLELMRSMQINDNLPTCLTYISYTYSTFIKQYYKYKYVTIDEYS